MLIISLSFFTFFIKGNAQCPEQGKPVLGTQVEIDSFLAIYPDCEYVYATYKARDGVQIFWVKEEVEKYLMTLSGLLLVILVGLKWIFRKLEWFQK